MNKRPRFLYYSFNVRIVRHVSPVYAFKWQASNTAVLVYQLPDTNYIHYAVRKRTVSKSKLPF